MVPNGWVRIGSGFATWKCHAILVVKCYCPWAKPPPKRRPHLAPVAVAAAAPVEGSTPKAPPVTQQKLRSMDFCLGVQSSKVDQPTNPFQFLINLFPGPRKRVKFFPSSKSSTEIEAAAPATATTSATPTAEVQTCTVYVGRISAEACGIRGRIGIGGFFLVSLFGRIW